MYTTILIKFWMASSSSCNLQLMPTGKILMKKLKNKTLNLTSLRQWLNRWCIRFKFIIPHWKIWIHQRPSILPLRSRIKIMLRHWKVRIIWNWWHVYSQTWYQLTKILWTHHQDRTQRQKIYGTQEIVQPHQGVSQYSIGWLYSYNTFFIIISLSK